MDKPSSLKTGRVVVFILSKAAMAELVDALDSGSSRGNSVDVRVILAAISEAVKKLEFERSALDFSKKDHAKRPESLFFHSLVKTANFKRFFLVSIL